MNKLVISKNNNILCNDTSLVFDFNSTNGKNILFGKDKRFTSNIFKFLSRKKIKSKDIKFLDLNDIYIKVDDCCFLCDNFTEDNTPLFYNWDFKQVPNLKNLTDIKLNIYYVRKLISDYKLNINEPEKAVYKLLFNKFKNLKTLDIDGEVVSSMDFKADNYDKELIKNHLIDIEYTKALDFLIKKNYPSKLKSNTVQMEKRFQEYQKNNNYGYFKKFYITKKEASVFNFSIIIDFFKNLINSFKDLFKE